MEERKCFMCGRNGNGDPLERHHVFGGAYRKKSEKYGAVVYLCGNRCHRNGPGAVHKCASNSRFLKRFFQGRIMETQGWDMDRWIKEFGKNYKLLLPNEEKMSDEDMYEGEEQ